MIELEAFLKEFGKQLKTTRKQMGLSQVTAAQTMHIDYRHYQNIEGGKINLRLDTLIKLVKFYNLDKVARPFNVEACMDLITGFPVGENQGDNWTRLKENFVNNDHAGFISFNAQTKVIESSNSKLAQSLGYRSAQDMIGKPLSAVLVPESLTAFEETLRSRGQEATSKPFIVTFRTQPPAYPIPMMAVTHVSRAPSHQDEKINAIFFDRKTLDDDGPRLKDMLNGYQQFVQLYPQLRAV